MKIKWLAMLMFVASGANATPYFQHAVLMPSSVQGQFVLGSIWTNAGFSEVNELPIFYRNAAASDPWYEPSWSPLAIGGNVGSKSASANLGPLIDVGPQIISSLESGVGLFSSDAEVSMVQFFNCSASATACGALSAGVLVNVTIENNGGFSTSLHALFRHPVGYFVGPSIKFGGLQTGTIN